jgi:hypothetical protein
MTTTASPHGIALIGTPTSAFSQRHVTMYVMIYAAITFWLSWFLMPDPGTTDAAHILAIVKESRASVLGSVLIQITCATAYLAALFLLVQVSAPQKTAMAGIVLFGIGAMGLCSDAFFHLLAYEMTSGGVTVDDNVVRVMHLMQTEGVVVLVPILLPFFFGSLVLAIGLARQAMISTRSVWIFIAAFVVSILGTLIATKVLGYHGRVVTLTSLALFSIGHAVIGVELILPPRKSA